MTPREERLVATLDRARVTPACPYCSGYTADSDKCTCRRPEPDALYTVSIPWVPLAFATSWHPTESTGPFAMLQRGCFKSQGAAIDWARDRLGGAPYAVRRIEEVAQVEVELVVYEAQVREDEKHDLLGHGTPRCVKTLEDALFDEVYDDAATKLRELEQAGRTRLRAHVATVQASRERVPREKCGCGYEAGHDGDCAPF